MKRMKKIMIWLLAAVMIVAAMPASAFALINTKENIYIIVGSTPTGKVGKTMTLSLTLRNATGEDQNFMGVGVNENVYFDDEDEEEDRSRIFPFEVLESTFTPVYTKGRMEPGAERKVSLKLKVRKDITAGYYSVEFAVYGENGNIVGYEFVNIWISTSSGSSDETEEEVKGTDFILGEGQGTPNGIYPQVMNYSINLRNNSDVAVYDVKASMVLSSDEKTFPFEINDANYDRLFDKIDVDQTVELPYSMAIRPKTYSGYYEIKVKISYLENSGGGQRKEFETSYYVKISNKEQEDERGDFNEHDRTRARIIVDSFETVPAAIVAGEEFELIYRIRNASKQISATNMLLTLESEKISDSAVFTIQSGSSSVAVDSLGPEQVHEIRVKLISKPGAEQRSYSMNLSAKYDSPEYKNAEEKLAIDIPLTQIPRLNTSSFEIMPDTISVGEETNVMFGINNTGKVLLYNAMVRFEADSIQPFETYVGNIKPGETGNVDCMLSAIAATQDNGMIKVTISYEDENGEISSVEKEMQLYVMEDMSGWEDEMVGNFEDFEIQKPSFFKQYKIVILVGSAAVIVLVIIVIARIMIKRKKKKLQLDEDPDDEI